MPRYNLLWRRVASRFDGDFVALVIDRLDVEERVYKQ